MTATPLTENAWLESLVAQVVDEFLECQKRGEQPDPAEYAARHPEVAGVLREVLAALRVVGLSCASGLAAASHAAGEEGAVTGTLGDFRILREIGRGGMGVVYAAEQISLGRRVALKVLPFAAALDPRQLQRFKNEAQAAAHLIHQNIVPVYYVGCERGVHFYAMQFIEGQTLAAVIHELRQLAGVEAAGNGASAAAANALARSLASSQWTTGPYGGAGCQPAPPAAETPTPPVAALSTEHSHKNPAFFRTAAQLGVQAAEALDHAHQLGIIHRDVKPGNLLVETHSPLAPLADDLRRFLEDKPIKAKRPSLRQRAAKWARRHKTVVVMFLLAVAGLAVSTVLIWQAKEDVKQSLEREQQNAYFQRIALAEREWSANNLSRMYQLLEECPTDLRGWEWHYLNRLRYKALAPLRHEAAVQSAVFSPDGRRIASADQEGWVKVWDAQTGQELLNFRARQDLVYRVAFSPDGRRLATASADRTLKTWDVQALAKDRAAAPLFTVQLERRANQLAFSPDGRYLASNGSNEGVKLWDAATGKEVHTLRNYPGGAIGFSPDGKRLAAAGGVADPGRVTVTFWDVPTGQQQFTFRSQSKGSTFNLAFSPDGRLMTSGSAPRDGQAGMEPRVWDVQTGKELLRLRGHTAAVYGVAFSPDGRRLATASRDQTVKLWDTQSGQEALTLRGHDADVMTVSFSPDGRRLLSASYDRTVRVWDATPAEGEPDSGCLTLRGHSDHVNYVAFHPKDPRVLASAGADGSLRLWDAYSGKSLLHIPNAHPRVVGEGPDSLHGLAFSPDGQRLATAGWGRAVVWETAKLQEVPPSPLTSESGVGSVAFSPNGRLLAAACGKKPALIWDATNGKRVRELPHPWMTKSVAFSPDSQRLASANADGMVRVWDVTTGEEVVSLPLRHSGVATSVAFSRDGRWLASASLDRTVKIWDTSTWKPRLVLTDPTGGVKTVAFSPDDKRLAWGSSDGTVKVWDEASGEVQTLRGHTGQVNSVAFSPDGKQIASASADGTVKVWDRPR
jgi:WD40 repeat protein